MRSMYARTNCAAALSVVTIFAVGLKAWAVMTNPEPSMEAVAVYRASPTMIPLNVDKRAFSAYQNMAADSTGKVVLAGHASEVPSRLVGVLSSMGEGPFDVALVVDITGSMRDDLSEIRAKISEIADQFLGRGAPSRIGIVWYTDKGDSIGWVSEVGLPLTSARPEVEAAFRSPPNGDGGDTPEHAYHGLRTAVRELDWDPEARHAAIIISDAPPHEDYDDPSPAQIRREIADAKIVVSTVLIGL